MRHFIIRHLSPRIRYQTRSGGVGGWLRGGIAIALAVAAFAYPLRADAVPQLVDNTGGIIGVGSEITFQGNFSVPPAMQNATYTYQFFYCNAMGRDFTTDTAVTRSPATDVAAHCSPLGTPSSAGVVGGNFDAVMPRPKHTVGGVASEVDDGGFIRFGIYNSTHQQYIFSPSVTVPPLAADLTCSGADCVSGSGPYNVGTTLTAPPQVRANRNLTGVTTVNWQVCDADAAVHVNDQTCRNIMVDGNPATGSTYTIRASDRDPNFSQKWIRARLSGGTGDTAFTANTKAVEIDRVGQLQLNSSNRNFTQKQLLWIRFDGVLDPPSIGQSEINFDAVTCRWYRGATAAVNETGTEIHSGLASQGRDDGCSYVLQQADVGSFVTVTAQYTQAGGAGITRGGEAIPSAKLVTPIMRVVDATDSGQASIVDPAVLEGDAVSAIRIGVPVAARLTDIDTGVSGETYAWQECTAADISRAPSNDCTDIAELSGATPNGVKTQTFTAIDGAFAGQVEHGDFVRVKITYRDTPGGGTDQVAYSNTVQVQQSQPLQAEIMGVPSRLPENGSYTVGTPIDPVALPRAVGGGVKTHSLSPDLTAATGITYDNTNLALTASPPTQGGVFRFDYSASDGVNTTRIYPITVRITPLGVTAAPAAAFNSDSHENGLTWTRPSSSDGVSHFRIYRDTDQMVNTDATATPIATVAAAEACTNLNCSYADASLAADTEYFYAVVAIAQGNISGVDGVAQAAPSPVSNGVRTAMILSMALTCAGSNCVSGTGPYNVGTVLTAPANVLGTATPVTEINWQVCAQQTGDAMCNDIMLDGNPVTGATYTIRRQDRGPGIGKQRWIRARLRGGDSATNTDFDVSTARVEIDQVGRLTHSGSSSTQGKEFELSITDFASEGQAEISNQEFRWYISRDPNTLSETSELLQTTTGANETAYTYTHDDIGKHVLIIATYHGRGGEFAGPIGGTNTYGPIRDEPDPGVATIGEIKIGVAATATLTDPDTGLRSLRYQWQQCDAERTTEAERVGTADCAAISVTTAPDNGAATQTFTALDGNADGQVEHGDFVRVKITYRDAPGENTDQVVYSDTVTVQQSQPLQADIPNVPSRLPATGSYTVGTAIADVVFPPAVGGGPKTYQIPDLAFETGLQFSDAGTLSGAPVSGGIFNLNYQARDSDRETRAHPIEFHIAPLAVAAAPTTKYDPAAGEMRVTWNPPASGGETGFEIYRATDTSVDTSDTANRVGSVTSITSCSGGTCAYTDSNLPADATYHYAVVSIAQSATPSINAGIARAVDSPTSSGSRVPIPLDAVIPDVPSRLPAAAATVYTLDEAIDAVTLPEASGGEPGVTATYALSGDINTDTGLSFEPSARTISGQPTAAGVFEFQYSATENGVATDPHPIKIHIAPRGVTATPTGVYDASNDAINLTWTRQTDGRETDFHIFRATDNNVDTRGTPHAVVASVTACAGNADCAYTDSDLTADTDYHYAIVAAATSTAASATADASVGMASPSSAAVEVPPPLQLTHPGDQSFEFGSTDVTIDLGEATGGYGGAKMYALTRKGGATDLGELQLQSSVALGAMSAVPITISSMPDGTHAGRIELTYSVTEGSGLSQIRASYDLEFTVTAELPLKAVIPGVPRRLPPTDSYTVGTRIPEYLLPAAVNGGDKEYRLERDLSFATGLGFNAETRTISGTPFAGGVLRLAYSARDTLANVDTDEHQIILHVAPLGVAAAPTAEYDLATNEMRVTWTAATDGGESGFEIYRGSEAPVDTSDMANRVGEVTSIAGCSLQTCTYTDSELDPGSENYYAIVAIARSASDFNRHGIARADASPSSAVVRVPAMLQLTEPADPTLEFNDKNVRLDLGMATGGYTSGSIKMYTLTRSGGTAADLAALGLRAEQTVDGPITIINTAGGTRSGEIELLYMVTDGSGANEIRTSYNITITVNPPPNLVLTRPTEVEASITYDFNTEVAAFSLGEAMGGGAAAANAVQGDFAKTYTLSETHGSLADLNLERVQTGSGVISIQSIAGMKTLPGSVNLTYGVTDAAEATPAEYMFTITVSPAPPLVLERPPGLPTNFGFNTTVAAFSLGEAVGGGDSADNAMDGDFAKTYTLTETSGSLADLGLELTQTGGGPISIRSISGQNTRDGRVEMTYGVTDAARAAPAEYSVTLTVDLTPLTLEPPDGLTDTFDFNTVVMAFNLGEAAGGGGFGFTKSYTLEKIGGDNTLAELNLERVQTGSGEIGIRSVGNTRTLPGNVRLRYRVDDPTEATPAYYEFTITVNPAPPLVLERPTDLTDTFAFNAEVTPFSLGGATGGGGLGFTKNYTLEKIGGDNTLAELNLAQIQTGSGVISIQSIAGTKTLPGSVTLTYRVTDAARATPAEYEITITVNPPPDLVLTRPSEVEANITYGFNAEVTAFSLGEAMGGGDASPSASPGDFVKTYTLSKTGGDNTLAELNLEQIQTGSGVISIQSIMERKTLPGNVTLTYRVTDAARAAPAEYQITITVNPPPALVLDRPAELPTNFDFNTTVEAFSLGTASGGGDSDTSSGAMAGNFPKTYTLLETEGALADLNLTFTQNTPIDPIRIHSIDRQKTRSGSVTLTYRVTDAARAEPAEYAFTITVTAAPGLVLNRPPDLPTSFDFNTTVEAFSLGEASGGGDSDTSSGVEVGDFPKIYTLTETEGSLADLNLEMTQATPNAPISIRSIAERFTRSGSVTLTYRVTDAANAPPAEYEITLTVRPSPALVLDRPADLVDTFDFNSTVAEFGLGVARGGGDSAMNANPGDFPKTYRLLESNGTLAALNLEMVQATPSDPISVRSVENTKTLAGKVRLSYEVTDSVTPTPAGYGFTLEVRSPLPTAEELADTVIADIARSITTTIASQISTRVDAVANAAEPQPHFTLGGHSDWASIIKTQAQAEMDGTRDSKRLLGSASFALSSDESEFAQRGFWGQGNYLALNGERSGVKWDGSLSGFSLGADTRRASGNLVGVSLNRQSGAFDVTKEGVTSAYELGMNTFSPYFGGQSRRMDYHASASLGSGEFGEHSLKSAGIALGGGYRWRKSRSQQRHFKGDFAYSSVAVDDAEVGVGRLRLLLSQRKKWGNALAFSSQIGGRWDVGGAGGFGVEAVGGINYAKKALQVNAQVRALLFHSEDIGEFGARIRVRVQPGQDRQGVSLQLTPTYGQATSGLADLWEHGVSKTGASATTTTADPADYTWQMDARLGYGLSFTRVGLVTPYATTRYGDAPRIGLGLNWKPRRRDLELDLFGARTDRQRRVLLKGTLGF